MGYRRLATKDRCQIEVLRRNGFGIRKIARELGFSPSAISREVSKFSAHYSADISTAEAKKRIRSRRCEKFKISGRLEKRICAALLEDWSSEQIVGKLLKKSKKKISIHTIYRYIARDKARGGSLTEHLRILRKQRKDRKQVDWRPFTGAICDKTPMTERPKIVDKRIRFGDIERDTVFGSHNGPLLLTMVDRKSRYLRIAWLPKKCSELIHHATVEALKDQGVRTITNDNGTEFAKHARTAKALNAKIYFSRAYASWERGTNENTNGLLRQYVPRKKDIGYMSADQVRALERKLNTRPRKCLGFKTPHEIQKQNLRSQVLR